MEHNFAETVPPHHTGSFACAAHVFGIDPSTATSAQDVKAVYAWVYCEETLPSHLLGDQIFVPVAIHLATPPTIEIPEDGDDFPGSVAKIFPAELRDIVTYAPPYVSDLMHQVEAIRPSPSAQHS